MAAGDFCMSPEQNFVKAFIGTSNQTAVVAYYAGSCNDGTLGPIVTYANIGISVINY
jgi:hypothetical protein